MRYAILGLLDGREMHGYALKAAFEARLGPVWSVNFGQIYQLLKDLRQRGFVEGRFDSGNRHVGRWTYTLTNRGRRALDTWLRRAPRPPQPTRDEIFIRLLATERRSAEVALAQIAREEEVVREHLARLISEQGAGEGDLRSFAMEAAVAQARAHLEWLAHCARILRERDGRS